VHALKKEEKKSALMKPKIPFKKKQRMRGRGSFLPCRRGREGLPLLSKWEKPAGSSRSVKTKREEEGNEESEAPSILG